MTSEFGYLRSGLGATLQKPLVLGAAVFSVGLILSGLAAAWQAGENDQAVEAGFATLVKETVVKLQQRVGLYEYGLRGARGAALGAGMGQLNRQRFRQYAQSRNVESEFPGARGFGIIRRVPQAQEAAFVAAARADGWPSFAVRQLQAHAGERYVIQYVEPVADNRPAVGLDIASEENRRTAAEQSMRTGKATLTGPITLVQAESKPKTSFLLLLPIYRPDAAIGTVNERQEAAQGWAYAPLVIDEVLADTDLHREQLVLELKDVANEGTHTFYSQSTEVPRVADLQKDMRIPVFGRNWELSAQPTQHFVQQLHLVGPGKVAATGAFISLLLGVLVYLRQQITAQATQAQAKALELNADLEDQVLKRTQQLDTTRRDLQNILDAVPSLIGYWDRNLVNRVANHAYENWFGVDPGAMAGMHIRELLGEDIYQLNLPHMEAALAGEPQRFERRIPKPDGSGDRHSLAHYLPDKVGGEVHGFYVLVHDVTELVEGRERLEALQRDNAALLQTIHLHTIVSVTDPAGRITEVNDAFCHISGYTREELLGQTHRLVHSGVQGAAFWGQVWQTICQGTPWRGEICNRAKDGSLYWVNSIIAPFLGADGKVERYISIRSDVTEAKLAAQALRDSQLFLERASRVAKLGAWQVDLDTSTVTWSSELKNIHEVPMDYQPSVEHGLSFYMPEDRPVIEAAISKAIAANTAWDLEARLRTERGRLLWVRVLGEVETQDGRPVRLVGILQDITVQKEAELALSYERHLMNSLLQTVPEQIYFKDLDSRFLRINPGLAKRYGLDDPALAIGKSDSDFYVSQHAVETALLEKQIMETGVPVVDLEEQETWPDRSPTWNLSTKMPLRDANGVVIGMFGISRDITARKEMEAQLHDTNLRFEMAADGAGLGVWDFDLVNHSLHWDTRVYELFGVASTVGVDPMQVWEQCLHPDDRSHYEAAAAAALREGLPLNVEFRICRPDGEVRYLKSAARVQRDLQGKPARLTGVNFDITESKLAEQRLTETSALLNSVLESASEVAIIVTDTDLVIRVFNTGAERLLGYSRQEMVGLHTPVTIHDATELQTRSREMSDALGIPIEGPEVFTHPSVLRQLREWTYVRKDGSRVTVALVVTAMHSADGRLFGYLGVAQDVSKQKEFEQSLRNAVHKAKQASLAKSQFLANMSHEIRTPMNAVIGLTYLLGHTALDPEQAAFLEKIRSASQSLLALINDVLDLSKIEANEMSLEQVPVDLRQLLKNLSELMALQAQQKGLTFRMDVGADVPDAIKGDATRIQQVLTNLLSNAIKFTPAGKVTLGVRLLTMAPDRMRLRFEVRDSGIGIPVAAQARLFQPFVQEDSTTTRRFGGTGLGLSIVKHLVTLMGGELGLNSMPGVGSEFWFQLDVGVVAQGELGGMLRNRDIATGAGLHAVRILVVDDSDINLEVARRILQLEGALVSLASSGQQAIDMLKAQPQGFDAVLMDVQMPELDGLATTRLIRSQLKLDRLPIIALTAGAMLEEQREAVSAGMNEFVAKPFNVRDLVVVIRRLLPFTPLVVEVEPAAGAFTTLSTQWPDIDGVDIANASSRMGRDLPLFLGMLKLLLAEYTAAPLDAESTKPELKQRLHKLKGTSGMLGLNSVHQLAANAEEACLAASPMEMVEWVQKISAELAGVQKSAAPHLDAYQRMQEAPTTDAAAPLDPEDVIQLRKLLLRQNMDAMDKFEAMQGGLRAKLDATQFQKLQECMQKLQFETAAQILEKFCQ